MKKTFLCVGAVAAISSLQAVVTPAGMTAMEKSKPWSVSASLRGFYDDNYLTLPSSSKRDSFGVELSPSASLNLPLDQTFIGLSYIYSARWFEDRARAEVDHSHQFNAKLDHAFSERYKLELSDSFVVAQEPEVLNPSFTFAVPLRVDGDNIRNTASAGFTAQITQMLGLQLDYVNTFYDYEQEGAGSYSARLDRMEHLASASLRWQVLPQTVGVLGYQFGEVDYSSDDALGVIDLGFLQIPVGDPTDRNNRSHYVFVGVDQNVSARLNASARVGAQYTEYYNVDGNSWTPYADGNLTYTYAAGSFLQAGVRHTRNQTDVTGISSFFGGDVTVDQHSTSVYASVTHRITARITGSILGQYQHSTFEGGSFDGDSENFFLAGLNLGYRFNPHWLAETGYNYDRLDSDLSGRSFTRNRVYVGLRATY